MKLNEDMGEAAVYAFSPISSTPPPLSQPSFHSVDIFSTQLASPEADSILMMHHTWHIYPLVIERRANQALHMIDEQMGF